ncbi:MAG: hypothetical protein KJ734_09655, partial [Chloroflexi bacterium]|nr:hypothetical protein [Chloroflexota bacterium]
MHIRPRLITLLLLCFTLDVQPLPVHAAPSLELYGTFHAMGIIVHLDAGADPDRDATATVEYRAGGAPYRAGFPLSRVADTRFVGSLFWLTPGIAYDVRVPLSDPDGGPLDGATVTGTASTCAEVSIPAPAHSYTVSTTGNDTTGTGTLAKPFATV